MNNITNNTLYEIFQAITLSTNRIFLSVGLGSLLILVLILFFVIRRVVKKKRKEHELLAVLKRLVGQSDDIYHLIDIRDRADFIKGHLPSAINVPYKEIDQFFPTEKMFTRIIICGDNSSKVKKVALGLSDRAYFRVDILPRLSGWDGEWETGDGLSRKDIEGERKDEVQ